VKASVSFCVLATYIDPQEVQRASKETEQMRFAVHPNG
jgi:hypothetical protein